MVNLRDSSGRSLYFSNRKEYYRRIKISIAVKKAYQSRKKKIYFTNFSIADTNGYVQGSLSSPQRITIINAKEIIRKNIPTDYIPADFYQASEEGTQKNVRLVLFRDDNLIIDEVINV